MTQKYRSATVMGLTLVLLSLILIYPPELAVTSWQDHQGGLPRLRPEMFFFQPIGRARYRIKSETLGDDWRPPAAIYLMVPPKEVGSEEVYQFNDGRKIFFQIDHGRQLAELALILALGAFGFSIVGRTPTPTNRQTPEASDRLPV